MKKPAKKKPGRLRRPPESTPRDDFESVGRAFGTAAIAKLPVIGDGIAAFLGELFPSAFRRRTEAWLREAHQAINDLRRRGVDVDALRENEEFADLVLTATQAAMRTRSEEKRHALRNAIVNAGLGRAPAEIKQQMFVRLIEELGDLHMHVLTFFDGPEAWFRARGDELPRHRGGMVDVLSTEARLEVVLPRAFRDVEHSLVWLALAEVERRGLVEDREQGRVRPMNATTFVAPAKAFVTPLGTEFLRFISDAPDA